MTRWMELPAHPILAGTYLVLALVAGNLHEWIRPTDVWPPVLITWSVAAIGWLASGPVTRDPHRRAVLSLTAVLLFSGYGVIASLFEGVGLETSLAREILALGVLAAATAAVTIVVVRSRRSFAGLTRFLNVMTGILVLVPALSIGREAVRGRVTGSPPPAFPRESRATASSGLRGDPDIYLILLDAYSSSRSLGAQYGFDNGPFVDSLRVRGFFVPEAARSNYVLTFLAVAALLNWDYLDETGEAGSGRTTRSDFYRQIEDSRTSRLLKERGYSLVFSGSAYPVLSQNPRADVSIPERQVGEFPRVWAGNTALQPLAVVGCQITGCSAGAVGFEAESAAEVSRRFELLARAASLPGPKFVLAHFLLPHEPMIFEADCTPRAEPLWPEEMDPDTERDLREGYVAQVQCTNSRLLELIDRILAASATQPIILVQSDHGLGRFPLGQPTSLAVAGPARVEDRIGLFAAYLLPGDGATRLYDSVTPVNAMRIALAAGLGLDLPLLEDRTLWSSWAEPFRFTRVDGGGGGPKGGWPAEAATGVPQRNRDASAPRVETGVGTKDPVRGSPGRSD